MSNPLAGGPAVGGAGLSVGPAARRGCPSACGLAFQLRGLRREQWEERLAVGVCSPGSEPGTSGWGAHVECWVPTASYPPPPPTAIGIDPRTSFQLMLGSDGHLPTFVNPGTLHPLVDPRDGQDASLAVGLPMPTGIPELGQSSEVGPGICAAGHGPGVGGRTACAEKRLSCPSEIMAPGSTAWVRSAGATRPAWAPAEPPTSHSSCPPPPFRPWSSGTAKGPPLAPSRARAPAPDRAGIDGRQDAGPRRRWRCSSEVLGIARRVGDARVWEGGVRGTANPAAHLPGMG